MVRRRVTALVGDQPKKRGRPLWWAYSVGDVAKLLELPEDAVRRRIKRGSIDPSLRGLAARLTGQLVR